jgi:hypothetical protein
MIDLLSKKLFSQLQVLIFITFILFIFAATVTKIILFLTER